VTTDGNTTLCIGRNLPEPEISQRTDEPVTDSTPHPSVASRPPRRTWAIVAVALAAAAALGALLIVALRGGDDTASPVSTQSAAVPATEQPAEVVDRAGLEQLAASLDTPVYWAGELDAARYEVTRLADGTVYVRYLPEGAEPGSSETYLTVATYLRPSAFAEIQSASREEGAAVFPVGEGGIAVVRSSTRDSVNFALPTVGAQIEVFSPKAGEARRLVESGAVVPVGAATPTVAPPFLATAQELRAFAGALEGSAYWAGPRSDKAYEVTRTSDGSVFVRYLPRSAAAGAPIDVLTVATYPGRGGIASLKAAAKGDKAETLEIPGGLAVYDPDTPTNVHLAFEGGDEQVEVYARSGVDVPALVERGGIVAIAKR
jgi:hypothetical protein